MELIFEIELLKLVYSICLYTPKTGNLRPISLKFCIGLFSFCGLTFYEKKIKTKHFVTNILNKNIFQLFLRI